MLGSYTLQCVLQFMVEDIGRYNYNGEIQDKLLEMNKPDLIQIKQKQVQHALFLLIVHFGITRLC